MFFLFSEKFFVRLRFCFYSERINFCIKQSFLMMKYILKRLNSGSMIIGIAVAQMGCCKAKNRSDEKC